MDTVSMLVSAMCSIATRKLVKEADSERSQNAVSFQVDESDSVTSLPNSHLIIFYHFPTSRRDAS
jgi:hypothetical protein